MAGLEEIPKIGGEESEPEREIPASALQKFKEYVNKDLEPYSKHTNEALDRAMRLLRVSITDALGKKVSDAASYEASDDIIRAVVVLTHAYLEDFLRTLGGALLPLADGDVLNAVSLVGSSDGKRVEKFSLGQLAKHRGKRVEDVIEESVEEHLSRITFNNATDIISFLERIRLRAEKESYEHLAAIDKMIARRHLIVHRADRVKGDIQVIDGREVLDWVVATQSFMRGLFIPLISRKYTSKFMADTFGIKVTDS